ncbi:MAG: class I SAM-dependent methyltransferase [Actinomycetota bacterium]
MEPALKRPDYLAHNRAQWGKWAQEFVEPAKESWAGEPKWGIWGIAEADVGVLPDVDGLDTLELGCGTAYVSAWLARRGARPVGLDPTPGQLDTARAMQAEHELFFPLVMCGAESLPFADASFDLVISEYGASIWSDPYVWVPEAARVLRPGGRLVFLVNGTLLMLCVPEMADEVAGTELLRGYFEMHRFEWPDDDSIEFHLGYGDWIRLLRANGFEIEDLIELRPPEGAVGRYSFVTLDWARRWPSEQVWKARKGG